MTEYVKQDEIIPLLVSLIRDELTVEQRITILDKITWYIGYLEGQIKGHRLFCLDERDDET